MNNKYVVPNLMRYVLLYYNYYNNNYIIIRIS